MRRFLFFSSMVVLLLFIFACGKAEVKMVPEESIIAKEAITVVEEIKEAYVKKDLKTIEKNSTKDGFRKITNLMKSFYYAELTFTPIVVEILENEKVSINISWKGTWTIDGKTKEDKGMAVFILRGKPLKIDDILRANPFSYPQ